MVFSTVRGAYLIYFYTCVGRDLRLLPALLSHYRALELPRQLIVLHAQGLLDRNILDARRIAKASGARLAKIWFTRDWNQSQNRVREKILNKYCSPQDWVVTSDVDEFQIPPRSFEEMVSYCEARGYDYVKGKIIDRVSADGSLPELRPESLWDQFPVEANISEKIMGACSEKVVLCRARIRNNMGQHFAAREARPCPTNELFVKIHHFKWDSSSLDRYRIRRRELVKRGHFWWNEPDRLLRFLEENGNRFPIEDPSLEAKPASPLF